MKSRAFFVSALLISLLLTVPAFAGDGADKTPLDAQKVFGQLKTLEGTWTGDSKGQGEDGEDHEGAAKHEFRVASAGTVVMETMNQDTDHEMINMYHVDGDELRLTHYCAGNNQPHMKLDREKSTADHLIFVFEGGTNLDPEVDSHIHGVEIKMKDKDHMTSVWHGYSQGEPAGIMSFELGRK